MNAQQKTVTIAALVLVCTFVLSVFTLRKVDEVRGKESTLEEILYIPSGKVLKRASLGYSTLLANVYWTRAVQYFGSKHLQRSMRYDLLYPLLDITTDLDPHLLPAYQSGSIFLSQKPPEGAGEPDKAVALVEKGIRENPDYWRLYFTLGFIHYLDRHDFKAAQQAFEKGSENPNAQPWMKVMAARMAEKGDDISTALTLWQAVYDNNHDPTLRDTAQRHINSLRADAEIAELRRRIDYYHQQTGHLPSTWSDLAQLHLLRGTPVDPAGNPYELRPDGSVQVKDMKPFPFLGEFEQDHPK